MGNFASRTAHSDRLGFFLFLAFSLHLMLILGLGFTAGEYNNSTPQLEVTLALNPADQAPEEAKFVAQSNQVGSGSEDERAEITTTHLADFAEQQIRQPSAAARETTPQSREEEIVVTVNKALDDILQKREQEDRPEPLEATGLDPQMRALNQDIASLEARLDQQKQALAERPRTRRLTSLSAVQAVDAAYLYRWRSRVEAIGNRYYPTASSRYGIYGDLRLLVAIRSDGSIDNIEVLSSSGYAVLDEAAIRIVRMAAPYDPFPPELRATTDRLEIIRTWKFRENRLSSVQG